MNDEQYFLANAYLDGELTADERRIAEADPEVMTEVEQLRALQSELRDVPGPSADARESAISAAMAAFGAAGATADTDVPEPATSPVVPFRPRPAYAKYLGVAAAVVAVAGLGIIVSQAGLGGDDDSADTAEPAAASVERDGAFTESADTADAAESEVMVAEDAGGADMAGNDETAADEMADDGELEPTDESTADTDDDAADDGSNDAGEVPTSDSLAYMAVPTDFDPEAPIADEVELGVYGVYLLGERDAGTLPPTPNHACVDARQILDEATLLLDDEPVPVYIDVRETDGLVVALRTDTCVELVVGSLFAG